ncbi:MAG: hypothetical protein ACT4QC_12895 [Planctomycetaceae bacterium]
MERIQQGWLALAILAVACLHSMASADERAGQSGAVSQNPAAYGGSSYAAPQPVYQAPFGATPLPPPPGAFGYPVPGMQYQMPRLSFRRVYRRPDPCSPPLCYCLEQYPPPRECCAPCGWPGCR